MQGGSSSVGLFAIQLAKIIGYKVIATCSPHSYDLVKSYGADAMVDYHNAEKAVAEIKQLTNDKVTGGIECSGSLEGMKMAKHAFGPNGGTLTMLLSIPEDKELASIGPNVKADRILVYTVGGYVSWICSPYAFC